MVQLESGKKDRTYQEIKTIHTDSLVKIAIFLEGWKAGKGNIQPLGTLDLEELWNTIHYLRGSDFIKAEKDITKPRV